MMDNPAFGWALSCVRCPEYREGASSSEEAHAKLDAHYLTDEHKRGVQAYEDSLCPACHGTGKRG